MEPFLFSQNPGFIMVCSYRIFSTRLFFSFIILLKKQEIVGSCKKYRCESGREKK